MPRSNKNKVTLKEIRETYYSLRNFEISNLWQRSIFLSAILVLFYSGYAYLVSKFLDEEVKNPLLLHELCCAISLLAIVFSIIWIMMAKGSKAWYEVYEKKICEIEKSKELKIPEDHQMGLKCIPWDLDQCLFSNHGGRYSVSKLNILIGKVLLINWTIVLIIHYIGAIYYYQLIRNLNFHTQLVILTIAPIIFQFFLIIYPHNQRAIKNWLPINLTITILFIYLIIHIVWASLAKYIDISADLVLITIIYLTATIIFWTASFNLWAKSNALIKKEGEEE